MSSVTNIKNNRGFSLIMLVVLVGVLALVAVWYTVYSDSAPPLKNIANVKKILDEEKEDTTDDVVFEDIPEDEYTPVEINNEALDELDSIMESLEEEDLSDLSDI